MSVPHTGWLLAEIDGVRCEFDGDHWTTPSPELTAALDAATESMVKHHHTIDSVAENAFWHAGLQSNARIIEWKNDAWPDELPPRAED